MPGVSRLRTLSAMRCDHCLTTPCVAVTTASISPPAGSASVVWQVNVLPGVVTNGTAVLGLGDIGPEAAKPVMEG
ncbi:hypothetical protein, partial [Ralstonia pseudosolanacearum]|uniref:hypothetical protein n=1 Tax=Ralstonia pseudosolanacearum TaxID=1310165 RepID=UPI003CEB1CBD